MRPRSRNSDFDVWEEVLAFDDSFGGFTVFAARKFKGELVDVSVAVTEMEPGLDLTRASPGLARAQPSPQRFSSPGWPGLESVQKFQVFGSNFDQKIEISMKNFRF